MATINGTSFADNLVGTDAADTIDALAGDDTIRGGGGLDTITTGSGRDTLVYQAVTESTFASNWDLITDFERQRPHRPDRIAGRQRPDIGRNDADRQRRLV